MKSVVLLIYNCFIHSYECQPS